MLNIEGFDEEIVEELQNRAKQYLLTQALVAGDEHKPAQDLLDLEGVTEELANKLAKAGIKTREDLAEMSISELTEDNLVDADQASKLIMKAREYWFE